MIGTIIWLIGVACAIWCVMDIFKKNISTAGKVIAAIVVLLTSWLGLAVYYFYGRDHLEEWFKYTAESLGNGTLFLFRAGDASRGCALRRGRPPRIRKPPLSAGKGRFFFGAIFGLTDGLLRP